MEKELKGYSGTVAKMEGLGLSPESAKAVALAMFPEGEVKPKARKSESIGVLSVPVEEPKPLFSGATEAFGNYSAKESSTNAGPSWGTDLGA